MASSVGKIGAPETRLVETIPRTFFVTGLGRSGTKFLATILNRSRSHRVKHEWHLPVPGLQDRWLRIGRLKQFPIYRFWLARYPFPGVRPGYGEVNSLLRFTLSAQRVGRERLVERRGLILRDPRDIVASAMNRGSLTLDDFPAVCERVLGMHFRLQALSEHPELGYRTFQFGRMTTDVAYLREIVAWTGIEDVVVTEQDLRVKINVNRNTWFPRWADWDSKHRRIYGALESRLRLET